MTLAEIAGQVCDQFHFEDTTVIPWYGEPRFAEVEGVVFPQEAGVELQVEEGRIRGQEKVLLLPCPSVETPDEAAGLFLKQLARVLDQGETEGLKHIVVPVEDMAGTDDLPEDLGRITAEFLLEHLPTVKTLVLACRMPGNANLIAKEFGSIIRTLREKQSLVPTPDRGGKSTLEPAGEVLAGSFGSWTLTYTVGRRLSDWAEIIIFLPHPTNWMLPQLAVPDAPGYTTVRTDGDARLLCVRQHHCAHHGFFLHVAVVDGALQPGDRLQVTLGDQSQGSPGIRAQNLAQRGQIWRIMGDLEDVVDVPEGHGGHFLKALADSPVFDVVAGPPAIYHLLTSSDVVVGEPFDAVVRVDDQAGNLCENLAARYTISLPGGLGMPVSLQPEDRGHVRLEGLSLAAPGLYRLPLLDENGQELAASNPIRCHEQAPARRIYWGDLHMHSELSDGVGAPEEIYHYAREAAALDLAALGDHDTFLVEGDRWPRVIELANQWYRPGEFVTLVGYEYTERRYGGDRNVYYREDSGPLLSCSTEEYRHPDQLYAALRARAGEALVIPHCCVSAGSFSYSEADLCPLAEIYSTHGNSEAYPNDRPLHTYFRHYNLYGPPAAYTEAQSRGLRMGVIGGSDDHGGQPGWSYSWHDYRGGIMGVGMDQLTRQSLWEALWARRTIATTGERIILDMCVSGRGIGEEGEISEQPYVEIEAHGTAKIDMVELLRDEQIIHCFHGTGWDEYFSFVDLHWEGGEAAYRCRLTQADGEQAWTSPTWVKWVK